MATVKQSPAPGLAETLARRDGLVVLCSALLITALAAWYIFAGAGLEMTMNPVWTVGYAVLNFLMWWIMMIAMMTPSAAPMLLLYTAIKRMGADRDRVVGLSLIFLVGYLLAWGGFSVIATAAQWQVESLGLSMGAMMPIKSDIIAGMVLLLAGIYQFSGFKETCLTHCRSPGQFLADHNSPGLLGALRLGVLHGGYCLGCCWALMALLFVGGIMNLYWVVAIALYVLAEKTLPRVRRLTFLTGGALLLSGAYLLISAVV